MDHKKAIRIQIHNIVDKTCDRCAFNGIRFNQQICTDSGCPTAEKLADLGAMLLTKNSAENKKITASDKNKYRNHIPHRKFVKLFEKKMLHKDIAAKLNCTIRTVGAHFKTWKEETRKNDKIL